MRNSTLRRKRLGMRRPKSYGNFQNLNDHLMGKELFVQHDGWEYEEIEELKKFKAKIEELHRACAQVQIYSLEEFMDWISTVYCISSTNVFQILAIFPCSTMGVILNKIA